MPHGIWVGAVTHEAETRVIQKPIEEGSKSSLEKGLWTVTICASMCSGD